MMRRIVSGVLFCGLLLIAVGCSGPQTKPTPGSCAALRSTTLVQGGVRYLYVYLPDGTVLIVNVDRLPSGDANHSSDAAGSGASAAPAGSAAPGSAAPGPSPDANDQPFDINRLCPCENHGCLPMCNDLSRLQGNGANLCTPQSLLAH
jgi:hypothetical protein